MKVVYIFLVLLKFSNCFKILTIFQLPSKSHVILGDAFVKHLLKAGHDVTYITVSPWKNPPSNLKQIDVSDNMKFMPEQFLNVSSLMNNELVIEAKGMMELVQMVSINTLESKGVQELLNDPKETFDAILLEWMFGDQHSAFASVFNCPLIWSSSMDNHWLVNRLVDESFNPSYTTDFISTYEHPLTFVQRVRELWLQLSTKYYMQTTLLARETEVFNKFFKPIFVKRGHPVPYYEDIIYNGSLLLVNSDLSTGNPISVAPNVKYIGGYHIEVPIKPLPKDLQEIMDSSQHGVIYFSLGSNLKSKHLPDEMKRDLIKMLGQLKQTVIWKFEEVIPNLPTNIKIMEWAPQSSILAHPKCILFITHGGLLSTLETIYAGVPIIGMPVFADQFNNINKAVLKGFAKYVPLSPNVAEKLKIAINEILVEPKYREKAQRLSALYHDRLVPPATEMIYWIEHTIRTQGALHLRTPALHMPFYQKLYLDLIALIIIVLIVLYTLIKPNNKKIISHRKKNK